MRSTTAQPRNIRLASTIAIVTWNCASLNSPDRIAALHDPSTDLGKADIVLLQEMRLAAPTSLPRFNTFTSLHHPIRTRAHQAIVGKDAGILIRNTHWQVVATEVGDYFVYGHIRIPDNEPAIGADIRTLHIWSIHAPPNSTAQAAFWNADLPQLSRLDAAIRDPTSAAIVGADWNAVGSPLDLYPPSSQAQTVPQGLLRQAGLVDCFRTLHPSGSGYTRFHTVQGNIVSARRLDGIAISYTLVSHLKSINTRPSLSDHSSVSISLGTSSRRPDLGPGVWRLHREAHLQPGFSLRIRQFAEQQPSNISHAPVPNFFALVERLRTVAAAISTSLSQQRQRDAAQCQRLASAIAALDIRHGDDTRAQFLALLAQLRRLDSTHFEESLLRSRKLHEVNMYRPTAWIIPRLESRSFAAIPDIIDDQGRHSTLAAKLTAIRRFYITLFTPKPRDSLSEEAASILLGSVQRRIKPATRHALETPFTVEELKTVLARAPDLSAPGMDGLTYPLLRAAGDPFLQLICRLGNALFRGHTLPPGEPTLRGVLLPKKGDLSQLRNYRPLSIAATAFRLLGGAISHRLQAAASDVVHASQTGFIGGRSSAMNVITLALIQHAVRSQQVAGPIWILNLDQQKAYDRVRHEWLFDCLEAYGFGPRFLTYIKEIYRHPSVCQSVEGHFTDPIPLLCGILQGDPMSCLLYNFSLQPLLDYARHHHHAGTTLDWDPANPLLVSSLAYADDILLVVNNRHDLLNFMDSLGLYEMASNAKVNEEKSQALLFSHIAGDAGDIDESDFPYPVIGESLAEIDHLGYPIRLDGGIPKNSIERRLASLQSKINILSTTKTTLLARARICNSFLLTKLWHSIRLCPLPRDLQKMVNTIVNPFLFLGRRNWLRHAYVVTSRHLGGLGVISTHHMSIALLGQQLADLLSNPSPLGCQFRAALQSFLWTEYQAIPAHFVMRRGLPWFRMCNVMTAQSSFMHRAVYTLCKLQLSVEPNWDTITVRELLALPFHNDMYGFKWPDVSQTTVNTWERTGLRVWGDMLWYNTGGLGRSERVHPCAIPASYPLVPPSASGVRNNYVHTRGHAESHDFGLAAGRLLPSLWADLWRDLRPTVAHKLKDITRIFALHPDHATSSMNSRPHDRPFNIDTIALPFPWQFATLAGKPVAHYTVKAARSFLGPTEPIVPDWSFDSTADHWRQVWTRHIETNLLTSEAQSDVFLFLHRRPWLAQKPREQRRLNDYSVLESAAIAPREDITALSSSEPLADAIDEPFNDAYESEHVFGVAKCMLCSGPNDSAAHGFVECASIQTQVWRAIMPTLKKLVGSNNSVPTDLRGIVLGWPDLKMPPSYRARLLLWRDLAIHLLTRKRWLAISEGLTNDAFPILNLQTFSSEHAALVATAIIDAYHKCAIAARPAFLRRWIARGTFLRESNGALEFCPMTAATAR